MSTVNFFSVLKDAWSIWKAWRAIGGMAESARKFSRPPDLPEPEGEAKKFGMAADVFRLGSMTLGPRQMNRHMASGGGFDKYWSETLMRWIDAYIPAARGFKPLVYGYARMSPFQVPDQYKKSDAKLVKMLRSASGRDEFEVVRMKRQKLRLSLIGDQLIRPEEAILEVPGKGFYRCGLVAFTLHKSFVEYEDGAIHFRGQTGDAAVSVPDIQVSNLDLEKTNLRSVFEEAAGKPGFDWGMPVTADVPVSIRPCLGARPAPPNPIHQESSAPYDLDVPEPGTAPQPRVSQPTTEELTYA